MFFPGTSNLFVPADSVFMFLKCMCNNISIEKKFLWLKDVIYFVIYLLDIVNKS